MTIDWTKVKTPAAKQAENLATKKAEKLKALGQWLDAQTASFEWQGNTYQTNAQSRERLLASLQLHGVGDIAWRTLDNEMVTLTAAELQALCDTIYQHQQAVTLASFAHKDAIEALTTVADVDAYVIE